MLSSLNPLDTLDYSFTVSEPITSTIAINPGTEVTGAISTVGETDGQDGTGQTERV